MNTVSKIASRFFLMGKTGLALVVLLTLVFLPQATFAATGTINPSSNYSQFLNIDLDSSGVNDLINWTPSSGTPVSVTDTAVTGTIWGETVGWINLNPSSQPVTNNCSGVLGGFAWGQNTGWINFAPTNATIAPHIDLITGNISGQVWSQNYGWIELASAQTGFTGLNTTWHGCSSGTSGGSGGTGVCPTYICGTTSATTTGTGTSGTTTTTGTGTSGTTTTSTTGTTTSGATTSTGTGTGTGTSTSSTGTGTSTGSGTSSGGTSGTTGSTGAILTTGTSSTGSITGGPTSTTGTSGTSSTGSSTTGSSGTGGWWGGTGGFGGGGLDQIPPIVPISIGVVGLLTTIPGLLARFGSMLLTIALYRRKRPWGVVFDAVTKEPLDPAYVSVIDTETNQEVFNQITDIDGRYGFFLKKGTYKIVVNKTNYLFPSKTLAGQMRDSVYENLYFGETFAVSGEEKVITLNVPMDPLGTDWNQEQKRKRNLLHYFTRNHALWDTLFNIAFVLGFIASIIITYFSPVWWNILMVALYVIIVVLQSFGFGPLKTGKVTFGGAPLPFAIVRVWSATANHEIAHRVTDEEGRYYILVPRSDVYITIEGKDVDGTYKKIYTSNVFHANKGVISESFNL